MYTSTGDVKVLYYINIYVPTICTHNIFYWWSIEL